MSKEDSRDRETVADRARRVHGSAIVIDTHIDTITHLLWRDPDFGSRLADARVDIPRLRKGGVAAALFAVWVDDIYDANAALQYVLRGIDAMYRTIDRYPDDLDLALSAGDIERIHAAGKIAVVLTIEGGRAIADDLGVLRMLHRLGVRSITLCWGTATSWIDSCNDEPHGGFELEGENVAGELKVLEYAERENLKIEIRLERPGEPREVLNRVLKFQAK